MRKTLLLLLVIFLLSSTPLMSLGLGFYGDAAYIAVDQNIQSGNSIMAGLGIEVGFLTPYLVDAIITIGTATINDRVGIRTSYILHYTYMLANQVGIYLGAGLGADVLFGARFSDQRDPKEASSIGLLVSGVFPLGVKFFPKVSTEVYVEARFSVGQYHSWRKYYATEIPDPSLLTPRMGRQDFYWAVGGRMGMRYWF